ncbi:MAG: methyltransferase, partial [Campylobacterota bacterium]|nr:methyltransferase [Campylobacterota bacterium]
MSLNKINLKNRSSFEILEFFENSDFEDDDRLEIEILESDLDTIGYKSWIDIAQLYFFKMLTP